MVLDFGRVINLNLNLSEPAVQIGLGVAFSDFVLARVPQDCLAQWALPLFSLKQTQAPPPRELVSFECPRIPVQNGLGLEQLAYGTRVLSVFTDTAPSARQRLEHVRQPPASLSLSLILPPTS